MLEVLSGTLRDKDFCERFLDQIYVLRHKVFKEQLKWDVISKNGREIDHYDDDDATYFIVKEHNEDKIQGTWRVRSMGKPNMVKDIFYDLCSEQVPNNPNLLEVSRMAVAPEAQARGLKGYGPVSRLLMQGTFFHSDSIGGEGIVIVTVLPLWQYAKALGLEIELLGPQRLIGGLPCVCMHIPQNEQNSRVCANVFDILNQGVA